MTADQFRALLRQRLESVPDRVLLRVLVAGRENGLVELTGVQLLAARVNDFETGAHKI